MRKITLVDMYRSGPPERDALSIARAIQRQISEDFAPIWGIDASLRVVRLPEPGQDPDAARALRQSDGIVYVSPDTDHDQHGRPRAMAYHLESHGGIPCGFVFPEMARETGQPWSVAAAHEILEMLVDPDLNQLVGAPHPVDATKMVLRPREVCDPVQARGYEIDGVRVADFVTPQYFTTKARRPACRPRTSYLGDAKLAPFGLLPGGSYTYFDLDTRRWCQVPDPAKPEVDPAAGAWATARRRAGLASRGFRRLSLAFDSTGGSGFPSLPTSPGGGVSNGGDDFPSGGGGSNT